MSLIRRMRRQTAVYWARNGTDDFGQPKFLDPVQIACRWEYIQSEIIGRDGRTMISKSRVYVDQVVALGGVLWLGRLTDINVSKKPFDNADAWEIQAFDQLPNIRNTETLYTAFL